MFSQIYELTGAQPQPSEEDYEYEALPDGHFARYMVLEPSDLETEPIFCTLNSVRLDHFPPFEAISYAWGTPVKRQSITCNGKTIRITSNLLDILQQVRLRENKRTLWVDSICINQANSQEQGQQVSIMGKIYSKAFCTLICLGSSQHEHAANASGHIAEATSMIQKVFDLPQFLWAPCSFPIPDENEPFLSPSRWSSFGILLQQPWFRRGWVVQEAILANRAVVLWGNAKIEWLDLIRVYAWYIFRALGLPRTDEVWLSELHLQAFYLQRKNEAITFRGRDFVEPLNILGTLDHARSLGVTDPRDRIYAFLNLRGSHMLALELQPNYDSPFTEVYRDFAYEYVKVTGSPDVLHYVQHNEVTLDSDLPSWVPRWDLQMYPSSTYTPNYHRYSLSTPKVPQSHPGVCVSLENPTLRLRATMIDTVEFAGLRFDMHSTTIDNVLAVWNGVLRESTPYSYSCPPLEAFLHTLRSARYKGRKKEWSALASSYMRILQGETVQKELYEDAKKFHELRMEHVHNKAFVLSKRGYYGLAPCVVQPGDIWSIISGTRLPFLLRRTESVDNYRILGPMVILSEEADRMGNPKPLEYSRCWKAWSVGDEEILLS